MAIKSSISEIFRFVETMKGDPSKQTQKRLKKVEKKLGEARKENKEILKAARENKKTLEKQQEKDKR